LYRRIFWGFSENRKVIEESRLVTISVAALRVSENLIIGIWLKREFERAWSCVAPYLPRTADYTKEKIKTIIDNANYNSEAENNLRLKLISSTRLNLLLSVIEANWLEKVLTEGEFRNLKVIFEPRGWNILSNSTGNLSVVAERVFNEKGTWFLNDYVGGAINGIHRILNSGTFDTDFILLESNDTEFTTILEGNKTAVAMYIKIYLMKETVYRPFRVFVGHLDSKSIWQW
jgi:hypothetical protein